MRLILSYRIKYNGKFYEAGQAVEIRDDDAEELKRHGKIVEDKPQPQENKTTSQGTSEVKKPGRPRRAANVHNGQPVKAEAENGRT